MDIDNKRCIFLDTETTGKSDSGLAHIGHRVIDIGAVEVVNRKATGNNFQTYLNPHQKIDEQAISVHGITDEFVADKPDFKDLADQFIEYVRGAILIMHNAKFDVGFLNQELELSGKKERLEDLCTIVDSYMEAKELLPGHAKYSLDFLSRHFNVQQNYDRTFHGALLDSKILADVYLAMTGGQNTLDQYFDSNMPNTASNDPSLAESLRSDQPFKIIRANEKELAAHAKKLASLNKKHIANWDLYYTEEY